MSEDLHALEAWMQGCILRPDRAMQAESIRAHLVASPTLSPAARLAIYQRGYVARLLQCLEGQFKALCHTLGKELFADFVAEYLRAHPSRSSTLSDLGARFPDYLEETRPDAGLPPAEREAWADFMVDLARYEWALYLAFDMEGHEGSPLADPATPDAALRPQLSLRLSRHAFPVDAYHHGVRSGLSPEMPAPLDTRLCVLRKDFRIGIFRLTAPQHDFLARARAGQDIETALRETAAEHGVTAGEAAEAWGRWRGRWIEQGFFVAAPS